MQVDGRQTCPGLFSYLLIVVDARLEVHRPRTHGLFTVLLMTFYEHWFCRSWQSHCLFSFVFLQASQASVYTAFGVVLIGCEGPVSKRPVRHFLCFCAVSLMQLEINRMDFWMNYDCSPFCSPGSSYYSLFLSGLGLMVHCHGSTYNSAQGI